MLLLTPKPWWLRGETQEMTMKTEAVSTVATEVAELSNNEIDHVSGALFDGPRGGYYAYYNPYYFYYQRPVMRTDGAGGGNVYYR